MKSISDYELVEALAASPWEKAQQEALSAPKGTLAVACTDTNGSVGLELGKLYIVRESRDYSSLYEIANLKGQNDPFTAAHYLKTHFVVV